jgi:hypothetical protein
MRARRRFHANRVGLLIASFALILPAGGWADDMYKTVDAQGQVTYSDRPLSPASQRISVDVSAPDPLEASRLTREQVARTTADAERSKQEQQQAEEEKQNAAQEAVQRQRCATARQRYALFAAGGRLVHADPDGNRVYYSDQEIDEQRALSKAAMDNACNQ